MSRNHFITVMLSVAITGVAFTHSAASSAEALPQHSHAELKQLQRDAHTTQQFSALAEYYSQQQQAYLQQAAEEKQEWLRRSQITTSLYAKYPTPADSARNLYDYYVYKANESGGLFAKYSRLASPGTAVKVQ